MSVETSERTKSTARQTSMTEKDMLDLDPQARIEAIRREASLLASVPSNFAAFVPFGDYEPIKNIIKSGKFFPGNITGPTGNGKTLQVRQACHELGREFVRANITTETDEDDLLGGFRLVNGNTVFHMGPVLVAMIRGAVLLLDELDYGTSKLSCIQAVLEGEPITLKRLGITLAPAPGFNVISTMNTKGRGDDNGKYIGTNLLNEALLDRFAWTIEQEYPDVATEKKILTKNYEAAGFKINVHAKVFIDTLAKWSNGIREAALKGVVDDIIATRRLVHIVRAYGVFDGDEQMALVYCTNRFGPKEKDAFVDLYNKFAPDRATSPSHTGAIDGDDELDGKPVKSAGL